MDYLSIAIVLRFMGLHHSLMWAFLIAGMIDDDSGIVWEVFFADEVVNCIH